MGVKAASSAEDYSFMTRASGLLLRPQGQELATKETVQALPFD